ncbi:plectin isoform X3 [Astyanax mexicanus]|uniref:plectin isoform X3 n=1 Tax=Astyanax mexicanus TaxID=7994 RepID=UPI0020CB2C49|nr:plectin isoform X3 [Astyanax mexicanus]
MVAGMVMPLNHLRAIYERLFRDGVMVAKKDKRPQTKHPEIQGVGNLQVIRAMGSLKSRGFVRETFTWRHFYWYLTNEGIVYLRDYLHLPPEIVPTPLQRVRKPAATLAVAQRDTRVQAIEGPTSYVPKPGRGGAESQEAFLQRQEYRRREMTTKEEQVFSDKTPRFRGRPIAGDQIKPNAPFRDQVQPYSRSGQGYAKEVDQRKTTPVVSSQLLPAESTSAQSLKWKTTKAEFNKGTSEAALIKKSPYTKTMAEVELAPKSAVTSLAAGTVAASMSHKKPKEEISVQISRETITSNPAQHVTPPPFSEKQVAKTMKATEAKNVHDHSVKDEMTKVTEKMSVTQTMTSEEYSTRNEIALKKTSPKAPVTVDLPAHPAVSATKAETVPVMASMPPNKSSKEKFKDKVSINIFQETNKKQANNATQPPLSQKKVETIVKASVTENVLEHPVKEVTGVTEQVSTLAIEKNVTEICRSGDKTSLIESLPSATISMDPPTQPAVNVATGDTIAVTTNKTHKEKKKDKKSQMLQELSTREEANDATQCLSSKKKQGKKVKATVTELVQEPAVSDEVPTVIESVSVVVTQEKTKSEDYSKSGEEISIQCLANTTASENLPAQVSFKMENPDASVTQVSSDKTSKKTVTEEVSVIISQETKDASLPASAKKKAGKKQKAAAKSGQDDPMKDKAPKMTEEDSLSATQILTTENYTSNDAIALDERLPKTAVTVDLQAQISTTTVDVVAVMPSESSSKSAKEKLGESVSEEKPQETSMSKEQVQDGSIFSSSKKKRDKKQKSTKLDLDNSENVKKMTDQKSLPKTAATDDLLTQLPAATKETVAATTSVCSNKTDKEKLEVSIKVSQDANTREQADDATQSPASKKEVEKKLKGSVSLMSPDESRKMTLKEEISVNNSQETKDEILGEVSMTATQNMISENYTSTNMTALIDSAPKTVTVNVDLPVISSGSSSNAEEKKLEVSVEQQQETSVNKDKAQDASLPSSSKKKREKKQKAAIIKNVHPVEDEVPDVAEKVSVSLMSDQESLSKTGDLLTKLPATTTETVAATAFNKTDKEKLEVSAHDSQDANAREQANNAIQSSLLKKEVKQTVKSSLTENVQQNTISEKTIKVTEKISMLVTQEKTSSKDSSESGCEKVIVELPAQVVTTTENTVVSMTSDKSSKKMLNQEAPIIISQEKEDVSLSASSKKKAGKKQKAVATKSVHNDPVKDGAPKVIEEVSMSTTQMLTTENYTSSDATASTGDLLTKHSATTTETVAAIAHECTNKTDKEKLEATINVSEDVNTKEQAGDTTLSSSLKKDAEKTVEPVTENVQEKTRSEDSSEIEENVLIKSLPKTKASEEEVSVIIPQEAKDASLPASTKKKAGKKQKGAAAKSVQADPMKDEAPKRTEEVSLSATQMKIPSEDLPNTEGLQKTVIITLDLPTQISPTTADIVAVLPSEHSSKFNEEKLEEAASVETPQEISASKEQAQDSSVPSSSKKKREKKPKASITKNIHTVEDEIPEVAEKVSVSLTSESAVQPEDLCLDLEKTENTKEVKDQDQHLRSSGSAVPPVAQKEKDTALLDVNLDADKDEANIAQRTTATVVATVPSAVTSSNAQKSKKKKAKKTSSIEETKDSDVASEKSEQTSLNAAKDVEIPVAETSTTKVKTEIKTLDHDPIPATEIPAAATVADAQAKEIFIHKEIQIVKQIITVEKEISKQVITSTQEKQQSSKPVEDSEAKSSKKQETEQTLKARKKGKKTTAALNKDLSPAAEIKTAEVMTAQVPNKDPPSQGPETPVTNSSTKMAPERMCTKDGSEAAAVETVEAPAYKGEVESAQPSAEKIKREVLKGKTSSSESAREAPTGRASAAASAQAGPHPEQGDPPSVAQYSAAPDTQHGGEKQKELSESEATELHTVHTGPLPTEEIICDTQALPRDEAAMRRKIVVVEEVIEVQQIASPGADGSPPVQPPVPVTGEELDYDVLEELAQERVILQGSPIQELIWDHSLDEPEAKTFPNFIEDERDRVQKKTFTKWVNKHLIKAQRHVSDLYEDLRDGHNLISLLEVLSGETLPREKGRMRFHKLQNVQIALDFLRHRQVKLVNIRNDDIADGNPKLTLGLIWTIILHFQVSCSISDIQVNGQSDDMSAKEKLLLWSQRMVEGYQGMRCDNFTTSWRDGKLFNAVIHRHEPRLVDMSKVYRQTNLQNLEQAFNVAEKELGVTRLLDPEDVDVPHPDEKSIITYVSSLYDAMPRETVSGGVRVSELELRWQEYYELVTILLQWIRHHVIIFEERKFPASFEEIEILWRQFLKFKETELPAKEADKDRSKLVYQSFESAVQAGQIKVPPGYHPIDVEKEWGRLHVAILERERLLRTEFERLERLQRIVSKVQMESGVCEEQLNHLETLLQSDIRLLSAGKPAQYTAEVGRDLDKADDMIRLLFNDVQILKDGRHLQAEQMYRRVYRLHERLVNLRSDYNLRMKSAVVVPPLTSSPSPRARPELDDVTLRYAQDLLAWVEENQRRIETAEWGSDLPTVESQLGSHRGLHQTVEDFKSKIERARADENQLSPMSKSTYREYLAKLDLQYAKLLNSSKSRLRNLDQLHAFVNAATKELIWLNDKEEEEVNFDWSDRNTNMTAKKENYSGLMRELELREKKVNEIQATGDRLIREGHPGKKTVEAFTAGLQTQWSWILQLCCCIEAHLKENTAYYQFFADVKEADEKMKKMQDTMKKKYTCDRSTTSTRLEDLVKDALDEKEQLNEFKTQLAGLNKRARSIIQLKPRNPTNPIKGKQPVQAVCDFKQMEITVHKGEECALLNNSQPSNWKVLNRSGAEAIVPSVCFLVPPVNKEAVESVSNLDAGLQQMTTLWQRLHIDMKSLLSWQYLMKDIQIIRSWNITMLKTMKVDEYRQILRNLELHYQDYLRDSQNSQFFKPDDRLQTEKDYKATTQHYENLLQAMQKGDQDESVCKTYITQLKDLRLQIEDCESRTVARIRQPVEKDPLKDCITKATDQRKVHVELGSIKKNLDKVAEKTEQVLASPEQASTPVLRSELDITLQKMDHTYNLSSVYLEKLKTIEMVIRNTNGAENILKKYEDRLREVYKVPTDTKEVESYRTELKKMRSEAEEQQPLFVSLDGDVAKAAAVSERMTQVHRERDTEMDHYKQLLANLQERWRAMFAQIDLRQRELDQLGRQLGYYRNSYDWLIRWIADAKEEQEKIHAVPITDSKSLKEQLAKEKKLLEEIEKNKEKVDECQKYAKAYIDTIKDYELQLVAYKAQVEPLTSPLKKTKMESASDNIIQEYVTLRTRYSELMTLTSQYIKFITDTQSRLEDEEKAAEKLKAEERKKLAEMQAELDKQKQLAEAHAKASAKAEKEAEELKLRMQEEVSKREIVAVDAERQKQNIQQEFYELKNISEQQIKSKSQQVEEALKSRSKIEEEIRVIRLQLETTVKQKFTAETELKQLRDKAEEAERLRKAAQDEAERLRKQVNEETQKKRKAEEELELKSEAEREASRQKQKALQDLEDLKMKAEEAERRMKQAEMDKDRQIKLAEEVATKSAATEIAKKGMLFVEKTSKLEESLKEKQENVIQLQGEAERLKKQQEEADRARDEAEKELDKWRQKANEALRLRLQAEEEAHKKTLAQEEAEKQKEEAEREAKKRSKAEESALKQKEMAEHELERQRKLAEGTAQQKLSAEQELIRLRAEFDHAEQQRSLLDDELYRLKNEVNAAVQQRKQLEDELAKVRSEMDILLQLKSKAEKDSMSNTEKSKQLLEAEAAKMRDLAEEAAKLRAIAEEAKRQRQVAEEEAARQRAEAERILKEKLAAINEATRLKTEAEIALKEKEAENERLRRQAEDEAYQRKALEDQASQHKQDIDEKINQLKKSSEVELDRQKAIVDETLKQRRIVEEEIRILKLNFEKASSGKLDLELELNKLKNIAEETQQSKLRAEEEAEKLRKVALEQENKRKEAEEKVKKIAAAEQEAARQRQAAQEEVDRLKKKAEEAKKQKEDADKEAERQILAASEAAQKRNAAEQQVQSILVQQQEDSLVQKKLKDQYEKAKKLAQEAEKGKEKAEKEAALLRQKAEEAERQRQVAEDEAAHQAKAQEDAERLRKEAELEAAKRAQAEAAALQQKQQADAEMAKHKALAEQTLKQKSQVEQELTIVKVQLDETDKQKSLLDDELHRLKNEVSDAVKQKAQVEDELFKVKIQMEELMKLKLRIEDENQRLIKKDKDNTQKFLAEEAENMKKLAEEAARLSVESQEAARMRQIAEADLAQQRALAEKMLKEKMQAIQEASKLRAEAEMLQKQKEMAQEQAQKLLEDKQLMQQRLDQETEGFQKSLEAERRRQLEITAEAERLRLQVSQLSDAHSKAEEEAKKFKKQANDISSRLHERELATHEQMTVVEKLEEQRTSSTREAADLRDAIAKIEKEKAKLKKEAEELQKKSKEMATAQQEQINQEKTILQQTFISEKEQLLKREKQIEDEKKKLENQYEDEVKKSKALKEEQERQQKQMEEEKKKLKATMDAALQKQKEAEQEMLNKQKAMQELEKKKLEQERMLAEENQKLREKLQQLEVSQKPPPLSQEIQTSDINGSTVTVDGRNGDSTLCFDGIREKVPASRLLEVGLLSKTDYDKLMKGKITVNELSKREDLKTALKGKNSIGGLLVHPNQKMSIYQAMKAQKILAGTGLQLLEAQAASGFLVDPIKNKKLTVTEAVKEGLIGPEYHNKMLSAEKAVTGYEDPYTGAKISLFENMKKGLIVKDHAIRLLEAQIATGGIIDAINSHRVSTEIAYKQGQFDEEMNQILQDPTDDTKAFFDPNTQENLTYLQLMERCIIDPETGLLLLPINEKAQNARTFTDEETRDVFKKTTVLMPFGRFQGKTVTIWEIINSEYFTEDQRKDLIRQYKTGKITVEKIIKIIITVAEEKEKKKELEFDGLRAPVPATELLDSKIIDKDLYNKLHQGKKTVQEVSEMETVHKALKGSNCIAGVVIDSTKETMSFYQAIKNDVMRPEPALALIEAQAASGYIVDPVKNQKFTVDEAVKAGAVGPELHEKLLSAERAVTGYRDPYTGQTVSLFEAMKKELIGKDQGIRFLDAQLATGGIIDPVKSHRIPHDIACKRGYFDDETNKLLSNPTDEIKSFYDPNTQEYVTYLQLQKRCITDKKTGLQLLSLSEEAIKAKDVQKYNEAQTKEAMTQATVELESGPFKGRKVTIWEIINSDYLTEEQRLDLIRQYRSGKVTIEKIIKIVITIVDDKESKKQDQSSFQGLRTRVPAKSLFDSKIIDKATYDSLQQGKTTPNDVSKNNSVNKYLQGSESIAGIFLEPTKEKVSIYQAMKKKLLRQNTGISLLEAQVATGFIVDPVKKQFLTVDDAVKAGLVGPELHEKLLTAEKAVTGYKDPFTGHNISLFQAMQKELIPKEHAMPLLEAQISTGGIIDPVNSHRIPTDVAYQKGYFSKEMSSSIAETANVNKTFSDPETDENVSYKQLKDKCMTDPETGLCLLPLSKPQAPTVVEKTYLYTEEQTQSDLSSTQIDLPIEGLTQGSMSLWDVMNSSLLPEEERTKLLEEYRSGKITKERMIIIIIEIMEQREIIRGENVNSCNLVRRRVTIEELYNARIIDLETFNLLKQEKKTIREIMELQGVKQYLFGTGSVAGVLTDASTRTSVYQAMKRGLMKPENAIGLLEAQAATGFIIDPMKNEMLTVDEAVRKGVVGPEIHDKLLSAERAVTGYKDPYSGKIISLFQAMKKGLVPEDYALRLLEAQTSTGGIIDPEFHFHLPADIATQRGYINRETYEKLSDEVKGYADPLTEESISYAHMLKRCKVGKDGLFLLSLSDQKQMVKGLRKLVTIEELIRSEIIDAKTASDLNEGLITIEELSERLKKYLEGTSCISGVYVESTKDCLSIYQAMKKNMIRPGTAFELLEAQAATGYIIDPIKNLKLTVSEAVKMGIVGPEFRDKLLSAERAVTGYRDPYTGKTISLFQAMKKGLILKDHGIRLLEAQIATGGIIDPEESHRLPVEVAYNRGLFDEDMNEILSDPSDDTKGFFDPNTEENLTYLQLMERCITDPQTGLVLLLLKEKKRERKTSSKSSVRKRRVVIVDPESGKEMSVYEAYRKGLIDHKTYLELAEQECEWEEITMTSSDGEEKSIIIDRRSGRQYDIADALARGLIDQSALDQYRSGNLAITEFADMLSGNMSGFRSRSSSFGSTSSYPMSPVPSIRTPATVWNDPTEETGPVAGILDTDTLEKVSVTEAMHRNLVDNITGQRLLEAQACTGGIIDLSTGEKLPVADALSRGLVDKIMVERINLAQKAFNGFEDPRTKAKMSAAQALKKGWLYYEAGQRFLEVQYLTGGLIEPETEGRVSLEEAIKRSLIDARTAQKLRDVSAYSKYLTCPKTKLKISYKDAMDRSMVEEGTGLRLLEACSSSSKGLYSPYNVSGAGSATGSRSGSRTGSRSGSRRGSFDATGSGFSMNFSSSSYSSTSYSRRY